VDCRLKRNAFFTNRLQVGSFPCSEGFWQQGISLWKMGKSYGLAGIQHAFDAGEPPGSPIPLPQVRFSDKALLA
jgi:hypothetical protein